MPLHLGQGAEDVDDDDKALFVQPVPPLTHTFHLEITPPSFTPPSAPTATEDGSPNLSASVTSSPPASPMTPVEFIPESPALPTQSRPHGKRRDPSYIPRPPNAFILFRSAFIRDQNIPGKVEGNHSKLSKIIGLCWKQLPAGEREKWEARAVDAQAEHRTRYPDWRFRPGANARLKAGESSLSTARRRSARGRVRGSPSKDGEEGESEYKTKDKGKSKTKTKTSRMPSIEETRCAKIANFVAEGLIGEELEIAVRQWEDDRRITRPEARPKKARTQKSRPASSKAHAGSQSKASLPSSFLSSSPIDSHSNAVASNAHSQLVRTPTIDRKPTPSNNPSDPSLALSTLPLTHMFKRHHSESVSEKRLSSLSDPSDESSLEDVSQASAEPESCPRTWGTIAPENATKRTHSDFHIREGSLPIPSTSSTTAFNTPHLAWQGGENQHRIEEEIQTSHSWWDRRPAPVESRSEFDFDSHKERHSGGSMVFATEHMGYETHGSDSQYNRTFMEECLSYEAPPDGTQHVPWTNLSAAGMNRQGLGIIIEDPYKDDCNDDSSRQMSSPPTLSIAPPPSSTSSFYYSSQPPPSSLPSSSYSALSGWAGDYKSHPTHEGSIKNWPEHTLSNASSAPSAIAGSPAWYNDPEMYNWSATRSQLQHAPLSVDPHDWDRHEQRVANQMNLRGESSRQLDFHHDHHGGS